jgi:hypothetical protein
MVDTERVQEGAGGRTYVVEPAEPSSYTGAPPGSVFTRFNVPTGSLTERSQPDWFFIGDPNIETTILSSAARRDASRDLHRAAMSEVDLIGQMLAWYTERVDALAELGVTLTFSHTKGDRPKAAAWITGKRDGREAQLIVWESGEAEFAAGTSDVPTVNEHHQLKAVNDLATLLDRLLGELGDTAS